MNLRRLQRQEDAIPETSNYRTEGVEGSPVQISETDHSLMPLHSSQCPPDKSPLHAQAISTLPIGGGSYICPRYAGSYTVRIVQQAAGDTQLEQSAAPQHMQWNQNTYPGPVQRCLPACKLALHILPSHDPSLNASPAGDLICFRYSLSLSLSLSVSLSLLLLGLTLPPRRRCSAQTTGSRLLCITPSRSTSRLSPSCGHHHRSHPRNPRRKAMAATRISSRAPPCPARPAPTCSASTGSS